MEGRFALANVGWNDRPVLEDAAGAVEITGQQSRPDLGEPEPSESALLGRRCVDDGERPRPVTGGQQGVEQLTGQRCEVGSQGECLVVPADGRR